MTDNELVDEPNPRAQIGGNQPRDFDILRERVEDLANTANEWIKTVPEITSEEIAARADDYLNQLTAAANGVEKAKKAEKRPHIDAGKEIERRYAEVVITIEAIKSRIGPKVARWLNKKQAAIDAEKKRQQDLAADLVRRAEAEAAKAASGQGDVIGNQVRAEHVARAAAEAQKAAARPVERAQVRGLYGGRARSLRKFWSAEVRPGEEAIVLAFCYFQYRPEVRELLTRLASAEAAAAHKAGREIPGCEIIEREVAA